MKKPPLGIMPRYIWESDRLIQLSNAIYRYLSASCFIPIEWIAEYNELCKKLEAQTK